MLLYKTICLHLLEDRPQLHEQLRQTRTLLPTLDRLASELKTKPRSVEVQPDGQPRRRTRADQQRSGWNWPSRNWWTRLPSESPPDEEELATLDAAMAFITSHAAR